MCDCRMGIWGCGIVDVRFTIERLGKWDAHAFFMDYTKSKIENRKSKILPEQVDRAAVLPAFVLLIIIP